MDMVGYGLRTDERGLGGVGVFLSGWVGYGWTRGLGGLLVIIHDSIHG